MEATTTTSEVMQSAVGALLDGRVVPEDTLAALTPAERAEIKAIAASAMLAKAALATPEPPREAEESSLRRAEGIVASRPPAVPQATVIPPPRGVAAWFARWRKKG